MGTCDELQPCVLSTNPKKPRQTIDVAIQYPQFIQIFQLLLITSKSSHEKWIVPGGGIDLDETAEEAVVREAYEEAGVVCDNAEYLGVVEVILK